MASPIVCTNAQIASVGAAANSAASCSRGQWGARWWGGKIVRIELCHAFEARYASLSASVFREAMTLALNASRGQRRCLLYSP